MNLSEIVTSLEMSRKLDKAGFKRDTEFFWVKDGHKSNERSPRLGRVWFESINMLHWDITNEIRAYTFSQIWDELPDVINGRRKCLDVNDIKYIDIAKNLSVSIGEKSEENLATQASGIWLYYKENGYIN